MSADTTASGATGSRNAVSATDACRMCMPLGACLAFAGMAGTVPFLHGSQGCATYIRRYLISHFNEPMDIASSSFGEASTVFGGEGNLREGIGNVATAYSPRMIGVATTCLTETIGEDVPPMLRRLAEPGGPHLVFASTPSFAGTHADGFHAAVAAAVSALAEGGARSDRIAVFPGIVSTADLRYLREVMHGFGLEHTLMPDWSDRLDGPSVARYERLPAGGTPLEGIAALGRSRAAVSLGGLVAPGVDLAGDRLATRFATPHHRLPLPIGIRLTDAWTAVLTELAAAGKPAGPDGPSGVPAWLEAERGRLVDAYIDGHKYVAGQRAVVYGDEDLVLGLAVFLAEIGVRPAVCASGGRSGRLAAGLAQAAPELEGTVEVLQDADFATIEDAARQVGADLLVGHSKGYRISRRLEVPLVRVGLPIHDRLGGQRLQHLGYRGTQQLFDRVVNAVIERRQDRSPVGYSYM